MPSRYEPKPPQDLRKMREKETETIDSATVVHWVIIPGFIGLASALIIGRIVPSIGHSVFAGHSFKQMGQNLTLNLDRDFESLTQVNVFTNTFVLLLLFGFILGIFIKFSFSDGRVK